MQGAQEAMAPFPRDFGAWRESRVLHSTSAWFRGPHDTTPITELQPHARPGLKNLHLWPRSVPLSTLSGVGGEGSPRPRRRDLERESLFLRAPQLVGGRLGFELCLSDHKVHAFPERLCGPCSSHELGPSGAGTTSYSSNSRCSIIKGQRSVWAGATGEGFMEAGGARTSECRGALARRASSEPHPPTLILAPPSWAVTSLFSSFSPLTMDTRWPSSATQTR